jgi:hypothetical protein
MKAQYVLLLSPLLVIMTSARADGPDGRPYPAHHAPSTYRQWRTSTDGRISVCLSLEKTTFTAAEGVTLRCAVRNDTDKAMTILRPFGDEFFTEKTGLCILGPDGVVKYSGPQKEYQLAMDSFIELPARSVVEGAFTIPKERLPGIEKPGLYVIDSRYMSSGYPTEQPPANFWRGSVDSNAVTVVVK